MQHEVKKNSPAGEVQAAASDKQLAALRPQSWLEFPGQDKIKSKLQVFVKAARLRGEPLDHILLSGPPGLGKTTLAQIIALELGADIRHTSGPALHKKGDLAALLTSLKPNSIFFIDEVHRLSKDVEEYLYSAMEDYCIDLITGEGLGARSMRFSLAPFTLIGATTRAGLLKTPFRDRFGIVERLMFYEPAALKQILMRSARLLNIELSAEGADEIARRSRGTPRVANRLLKRVRDYAQVQASNAEEGPSCNATTNGVATSGVTTGSVTTGGVTTSRVSQQMAQFALNELEVDSLGLDPMDRRMLHLIEEKFSSGPVGLDTLSAALNEEPDTIEEVYEPFLLQMGFLQKTPRGRVLTSAARQHIQHSHLVSS